MTSVCTDTFPASIDYSGRPHIPLHVKINNRGHVFRRDTLENVIFYDILFTNFGIAPLSKRISDFILIATSVTVQLQMLELPIQMIFPVRFVNMV